MNRLFMVVIVLLLGGCGSSKYPVTFTSEPSNAVVTCNNKVMGYTPITLYYEREQIKGDTLPLDCYATYASGLNIKYESGIPLKQYPDGANPYVYIKKGYPLYHIDAQAAIQGAQQRENDRQRQNQQNQQEMQAIQQQLGNIGRTTNTNCYKVGNQVFCNTY